MKKLTVLILSCLVFLGSAGFQSVFAADFRTGEDVIITEGTPNLKDMYLFGGNIKVNAPIQNDVVLGGGDITLDEDVSGSVMAGGGDDCAPRMFAGKFQSLTPMNADQGRMNAGKSASVLNRRSSAVLGVHRRQVLTLRIFAAFTSPFDKGGPRGICPPRLTFWEHQFCTWHTNTWQPACTV